MTDDRYMPRPGDIVLVPLGGPWAWLIALLQAIIGHPSPFSHAAIVVSATHAVEGRPPRAGLVTLDELMSRRPCAVLAVPPEAEHLRPAIVEAALNLQGARYQWVAFLWMGLSRLPGGGIRPHWMCSTLASTSALICSALVDAAWHEAGLDLFDDGRLMGAVTPGEIHRVGVIVNVGSGPFIHRIGVSNGEF